MKTFHRRPDRPRPARRLLAAARLRFAGRGARRRPRRLAGDDRLALDAARGLPDRDRRAGDLPGHGGDRPRRARLLRRRGAVAVLRRARPYRAGQRRAEAAVDRRLFARRLRRRIGEPDLLRRQHDDLRAVGGPVPHRRGDPRASSSAGSPRPRCSSSARSPRSYGPNGADPLRPRAPDRQGLGLPLAGAALRSARRATTRSTSPSSAPGSAA